MDSIVVRRYISLTKPGIVMGNAITAAAGFVLASNGAVDYKLLFTMLMGLCLIMASGCVSNNAIDRKSDAKMSRTKNRALAQELIEPRQALLFAVCLCAAGTLFLASVSLMALLAALIGFFVYVAVYSYSKHHSMYATWIGSIAGAIPPVVGYTAVSHSLDAAALLLFLIVAIWQLPHFFAIAIYRLEDYTAASIPVLPRVKGILATKVHMLLYIVLFTVVASLLPLSGRVGYGFLFAVIPLGVAWGFLCIQGFTCNDNAKWAKKMFFFSLAVIIGVSIAIPFSLN